MSSARSPQRTNSAQATGLAAHRVSASHRSSLRLAGIVAHLRALSIDRELAEGVPSWCSPIHAARSLQLTSNRSRRNVARSLERLVELAELPPTARRGAAISPSPEQVRASSPLITRIASRLRSPDPVDARGVAALRELLCDGASPCYAPAPPGALVDALQGVSQWLEISG